MNLEVTKPDKNVAALIHLSTFSQFFFPFGNFILPLILWATKKNDPFVDEHGKQALNFQISIYLYMVFLTLLGIAGVVMIGINLNIEQPFYFDDNFRQIRNAREALPVIIWVVVFGVLVLGLFVLNLFGVISATIKAGEGHLYKYPLSINFLGARNRFPAENEAHVPSENSSEADKAEEDPK